MGRSRILYFLLSCPKLPASEKQLCAARITTFAAAKASDLSYLILDLLDVLKHSKSKKSEMSHVH